MFRSRVFYGAQSDASKLLAKEERKQWLQRLRELARPQPPYLYRLKIKTPLTLLKDFLFVVLRCPVCPGCTPLGSYATHTYRTRTFMRWRSCPTTLRHRGGL